MKTQKPKEEKCLIIVSVSEIVEEHNRRLYPQTQAFSIFDYGSKQQQLTPVNELQRDYKFFLARRYVPIIDVKDEIKKLRELAGSGDICSFLFSGNKKYLALPNTEKLRLKKIVRERLFAIIKRLDLLEKNINEQLDKKKEE